MLPIGQAASFASAMAANTAAGVAAIPPLVELIELVESLNFTPPKVEALPVGSVYLVSVVGGVYPKALVTFAFVKLIVPEFSVMLLPIFTPPKVQALAVGSVYLVSVVGGV